MNKLWIVLIMLFLLISAGLYVFFFNTSGTTKLLKSPGNGNSENKEVIAQNLEVPWDLVFLPNGSILFTERVGQVRFIDQKGLLYEKPAGTLSEVFQIGEGGLLGIEKHPDFNKNNYIYVYYTYGSEGNRTLNRVSRLEFINDTLQNEKVIVDEIPGSVFHNGGRIKFGPDDNLYITTGDAQEPSLAQDTNSLAGKILRVNDEGRPIEDNPFNNAVYSYGHRNPQGLAWDSQGRLWATEHGPSNLDEINVIEIGKNYGWPTITGDQSRNGMEVPEVNSGSDTWAPSGAVFHNGSVFFAGLRGNALYEISVNNPSKPKEYFKGQYGRLRGVVMGPDSMFYITTSNQDGRGSVLAGDDKIIKIDPESL